MLLVKGQLDMIMFSFLVLLACVVVLHGVISAILKFMSLVRGDEYTHEEFMDYFYGWIIKGIRR